MPNLKPPPSYRSRFTRGALALLLALVSSIGQPVPPTRAAQAATILYARPDGRLSGACSSWAYACKLYYALTIASSGDEIWAAQGVYTPTTGADRTDSFELGSGVALYGGFIGTETDIHQRDWVANVTTLSGEIGAAGPSDNSYHVVVSAGMTATTIIDGFTITRGNADGGLPDNSGGGMYVKESRPIVTNIIFSDNLAGYGGGMYNTDSSPSLTHVTFSTNSAYAGDGIGDGGGMYNTASNPVLTNVTFKYNTAANNGGGIYNGATSRPILTNITFNTNSATAGGGMANLTNSSPALTNVTFSTNSATYGGGLYNFSDSQPVLTNVTFRLNSATYGTGIYNDGKSGRPTVYNALFFKGTLGANCGGLDFAAASANNLANDATCGSSTSLSTEIYLGSLGTYGGGTSTAPLLPGSAAIDTGDPAYCPVTDQRGAGRVDMCDIGAFEAQGFTLAVESGSDQSTPITQLFPQPLRVSVTSNASPADPVGGGRVTFTAPPSGASLYPAVATAAIASGVASLNARANGTVSSGTYVVVASAAGAAPDVYFVLTNENGHTYLPATLKDYMFPFEGPSESEDNDAYTSGNGPLRFARDYTGYFDDEKDYFSAYLPTAGTISVTVTHAAAGVQLQLFYQDVAHRMAADTAGHQVTCPNPEHLECGQPGWYYIYLNAGMTPDGSPYTLQVTYASPAP